MLLGVTAALKQSRFYSGGPQTGVRDLGLALELSSPRKGPWESDPTHLQTFPVGQACHNMHRHNSYENHANL